ncbi:MAG: HAD-IA family hydrolase [Geobacter sp.]|nr:HAD-IA family hydrolase [Geobacter sp.]
MGGNLLLNRQGATTMQDRADIWGLNTLPSLVIFDLDGTLIDSLAGLTESINAMRKFFDLPLLPLDAVRSAIGKGARNLVSRCLPEGDERIDTALKIFLAHNGDNLAARTTLYPWAKELLAELHGAGIPLALVSNKNSAHCKRLLSLYGIAGCFQTVLGGDALAETKPLPGPLLAAMDSCKASAAATVMIGDSCNDFEAARMAGIRSIGCRFGYGEPWELELADARIAALDELLPLPW